MASMMVSVRDLTMVLASGGRPLTILDRVSLDVERGTAVAVIGPSGSGKSTLLGLVAGLDAPTSGTILVGGVDVTRLGESALARFRRETIGYVFQSYHLIPMLMAAENVGVPLELAGERRAAARARALLEHVGLADRAHHYPVQLSGGEQQRVALARAVALDPPLLLADEPTGNLDSATSNEVMAIFQQLRSTGITIVLVTHEPDIASFAARVVVLKDGHLLSDHRQEPRSAETQIAQSVTGGAA
jgi:putative ABC transport system ATP-binding protein